MNRKLKRKIKKSSIILSTAIAAGTTLVSTGIAVASPIAVCAEEVLEASNSGENNEAFNEIDADKSEKNAADEKTQNDESSEVVSNDTQSDGKGLGGGGGPVVAFVNAEIVDSDGNIIKNATIDVTFTTLGDSEDTVQLGTRNEGGAIISGGFAYGYDSFKLHNLNLPDGYEQPTYTGTDNPIFGDGLTLNYNPDNGKYTLKNTGDGSGDFSSAVTLTEGTSSDTLSYTVRIKVKGEATNNYIVSPNEFAFAVKWVDKYGNEVKDAEADAEYEYTPPWGTTDELIIKKLLLPEGYYGPKRADGKTEIFNGNVTVKYNPDKDTLVFTDKDGNTIDYGNAIKIERLSEYEYRAYRITIALEGDGITYYNEIGGNRAGQEDPKFDAVYTIGSGEEVTLVFKRTVKDEETFSHFSWLEYGGPNEGKEYDPRLNSDYHISQGSVKVALTSKYLDKLGVGEHIFYAHFDDNIDDVKTKVMAKIKIVAPEEPTTSQPEPTVPTNTKSVTQTPGVTSSETTKAAPTGDKSIVGIWSGIASGAGIATTIGILTRKRKIKN